MLPGIGGAIAGPISDTSLIFVASATSNAATITIPASATTGDIAVLLDYGFRNNATPPTAVTPSGFTLATNANVSTAGGSTSARGMITYRILTAGQGGTSVTGMNTFSDVKIMLVFRRSPVVATAVVSATFGAQGTGGNPTLQTVSASGQGTPLIVVGHGGAELAGTFAFSTASPAFDATIANEDPDADGSAIIGYKIYSSGPQDHSIDMNAVGDNHTFMTGWLTIN